MIQTENMEFQSENGYAEQLNLFQMESRSDLLLKEQEYIQTSRLLLLVISGCLIFIGIMNFKCKGNGYVTSEKRMCHYESCGMTRKQLQRMFLAEGMFTWLLLSVLLVTIGTLLIGGIGWYMKTKISYFVFYYPMQEMVALLMILPGRQYSGTQKFYIKSLRKTFYI